MGHFCAFAAERGWSTVGAEASGYAVEAARQRCRAPFHCSSNLSDVGLSAESFDAVTMIEVVEHLSDPLGTIREVFRLLKPGGIFYLTTPNFSSFLAVLLQESWDVVIPTGHLYYFDPNSLSATLAAAGFQRVMNHTPSANFDQELCRASKTGLLALEAAALQRLRMAIGHDEAHRSERLVMLAQKTSGLDIPSGENRFTVAARLEGQLIRRPGSSPDEMRVFLVEAGRRRWITDPDWIRKKGRQWPDDVQVLDHSIVLALPEGPRSRSSIPNRLRASASREEHNPSCQRPKETSEPPTLLRNDLSGNANWIPLASRNAVQPFRHRRARHRYLWGKGAASRSPQPQQLLFCQ